MGIYCAQEFLPCKLIPRHFEVMLWNGKVPGRNPHSISVHRMGVAEMVMEALNEHMAVVSPDMPKPMFKAVGL